MVAVQLVGIVIYDVGSIDVWSCYRRGKKGCQVCSVWQGFLHIGVQGLNRLAVLPAIVLFFITLKHVSTHTFGVALKDSAVAVRCCLLSICADDGPLLPAAASASAVSSAAPAAVVVGTAAARRASACGCVRGSTHSSLVRLLTARHVCIPLSVTKCTCPL